MRDKDIRILLHNFLEEKNKGFSDTVIVDELDICKGLARVDIAVVNGFIHGYEIKSEFDTLQRLPNQIKYYNKALEKVTLALHPCHLNKSLHLIPDWWGILVIDKKDSVNEITEVRKAEINNSSDPDSLLQLLWKNELFTFLIKYNLTAKSNLSKAKLRECIIKGTNIKLIKEEVRRTLKLRKNWRY